jgi:hypothetical protein
MNRLDWNVEQRRFLAVAYEPTLRAAERAFKRWPERKRDDGEAEFMGKVWDQWKRLLERGKDPEPLLYPMIHWAKQWVRYDRRIASRPRNIGIEDHRAGMVQHLLDGRGKLEPHDRSARINDYLDWTGAARTDNPAELASALEETGLTLEEWCDL